MGRKDSPIIIFDTETTGIGVGHGILDFAAVLFDNEQGEVVDSFISKVNPGEGALKIIDPKAVAVHGITAEMARGFPEKWSVMHDFASWVKSTNSRRWTSYRMEFDFGMVEETWPQWEYKAMRKVGAGLYRELCLLDQAWSVMLRSGFVKKRMKRDNFEERLIDCPPNLTEAHIHFTGEGFGDAHSAFPDALAAARVYKGIRDWRESMGIAQVF